MADGEKIIQINIEEEMKSAYMIIQCQLLYPALYLMFGMVAVTKGFIRDGLIWEYCQIVRTKNQPYRRGSTW